MKGYKTCPNCHKSIRGANTRICPHCKEDTKKQLSPAIRQAGKNLREYEQRRKWRIEEAVRVLKKEAATLDEINVFYMAA